MNQSWKPHFWILLLAYLGVVPLRADDWTQFLGNDRNGLSAESELMDVWPPDGPQMIWQATVGEGMSGCVVADGKLVTIAQDARDQYAICLSAGDGATNWRRNISDRYENGQGNGPRATPTVVDGSVYVYTGDGVIARLNLNDGEIAWKIDACEQFGGKIAEYGLSCSPLVADGCVVFTIDTDGSQTHGPTVCVRASDGELKWISVASPGPDREPPGYSSPVVMSLGGKDYVVLLTGRSFKGIDLQSGRTVWSETFETDYACNTASPLLVEGNKVFISAGENHGCALFEIDLPEGSNKAVLREIWNSYGPKSVMRNEWQTSVLDGDYLYGFDNQGSAGAITNLSCVNWKTGEQQWIERRFGKGNMISADGKLWMSNMDGELVVANVDPSKYIEWGRKQVIDSTRQAPALSNGFLFFRGKDKVVCVDVR